MKIVATDLAAWRVFEGGHDLSRLWELAGEQIYAGFPDHPERAPELPLDEVQEALVEALANGHVRLYDEADDSTLTQADALSVARDPAYFDFDTAPRKIGVAITDAGYGPSGEAWLRYRAAMGF